MPTLLRALRHRPFALLWSGQTISVLGDRMFQVALAWWVLQETGSAAAMATVILFGVGPMLVFVLVGGVLVDRFAPGRLMLVSDVTRGLAVGLAALLMVTDSLALWHVYILSLVVGLVEAFFVPAYRVMVPEVVPDFDLLSANSLTSLSGEVTGIVGPALGAGMIALAGTGVAFAVNAGSFLIAALCVLPVLGVRPTPGDDEPSGGFLGELRTGLSAVRAMPWLWVTIGVAGLSNIAYSGPMDVALPFLISARYGDQVGVLGLFYSASSLGAILASAWLGRRARLRRRGLALYVPWLLIGLFMVVIGLPIAAPALLITSFCIGVCNATLGLVWINSLQELVPRHLLGRVTSVDYFGSLALLPVGYAVGGWAADRLGPDLLFVLGGVLHMVLVAAGLLHPKVRSLD